MGSCQMTLYKARAVLKAHNAWRRDTAGLKPEHSAEDVGIAIDVLLEATSPRTKTTRSQEKGE